MHYQHTTGAVVLAEHEAGIVADLEDLLERMAPVNGSYLQHVREVDQNGHAHVRSIVLGTSVSLPILSGSLVLGSYQDILVVDMQTGCNTRQLVF